MGALELIAARCWLQWCCAITIITIIAIIAIVAWTSLQLCQLVYLGSRHFLAVHFGMQAVRRTWSSCPKCYSRCLHELLPVGTYAILGDHTWLFPVCWSRRCQPNGQCLQQHGDFTISKFQSYGSYGLKYLIFAPPLKMCDKLSICKALRFQFGTCRWGDLKIKAPFVYRAWQDGRVLIAQVRTGSAGNSRVSHFHWSRQRFPRKEEVREKCVCVCVLP